MKNLLLYLLLFSMLSTAIAQDVILTVSGEVNSKKVSLDSILVENLTNKTWLSLTDLPLHEFYQINLTKKAFWGTVGIHVNDQGSDFTVIQNQPGIMMIASNFPAPVESGITLYNTNGQMILQQSRRKIYPGQTIRIMTGGPGLFLLKIDAPLGINTFKVLGSSALQSPAIEILDGLNYGTGLKNAAVTSDFNFSYNTGDNIRVSVYKSKHSSNPVARLVNASEHFSFLLSEIKDTTIVMNYGRIDITEIPGLNIDGLTVESVEGSTPVLLNATFNTVNKSNEHNLYPIFFKNKDEVLFGVYPNEGDLKVGIDDIIFFFYKMFPHIRFMELTDQQIDTHMKDNPDYTNLRNAALAALEEGLSPIDDDLFLDMLSSHVEEIFQSQTSSLKSTSEFNKLGELEFTYDRDRKIKWPNKLPFYAFVGVEISDKSTGEIVMKPRYIKPDKFSFTPDSWYSYLYETYNYMIKEKINDPMDDLNHFTVKSEGSYIVSFTNGNRFNDFSTVDRKFNHEVAIKNAEHLVLLSILTVLPKDLKEIAENTKCFFELLTYMQLKIKEFTQLYENNQLSESSIKEFLLLVAQTAAASINKCFPESDAETVVSAYLKSFLKLTTKLKFLESGVNIGFGFKDWVFSQVSGTDVVHFYDQTYFQKLEYTFESNTDITDSYKSNVLFEGKEITETKNIYHIIRDLSGTRFNKVPTTSLAGGFRMKATLVEGDAKILNEEEIFTGGGSYLVDLEMGSEPSLILIEPDLKNSGVDILALTLTPLSAASVGITGGNNQSGVVNKELFTALSVQVKDEKGNPVRNADVSFEPACEQCGELRDLNAGTNNQEITKSTSMSNNRAASTVLVKSDEQGVASAAWTLGSKNGEQKVIAKISGNTEIPEIIFFAQAQGEPAAIVIVSGQGQSGTPGQYLSRDLKVMVTDKDANGLKGITVVFQVDCQDCGEVDLPIVITDSEGYASTRWKIGNSEEDQLVMVTLPGYKNVPAVLFKAQKDESSFTDSRDGKTYKTVKIGNQVWMAENLAYLPSVSLSTQVSITAPYYYVYDYQGTDVTAAKLTNNYKTYGVLYNGPASLISCPAGWHLPSDAEWKQMEMALGMIQSQADETGYRGTNQGEQMKATNGWSSNGNGTNSSGFSALPGGTLHRTYFTFNSVGDLGAWWSSSGTWVRGLFNVSNRVYRDTESKASGFSVRCVRD